MPSRTRFAVLSLAATVSMPALAQVGGGDALAGRALFDDTMAVTGRSFSANCSGCHSVQSRRAQLGNGDAFAVIAWDAATGRLVNAITGGVPDMAQFNGVLTQQQVYDLGAYIADTPSLSTAALDFTAAASGTATTSQTVDLRHALATAEPLVVVSVAIGGAGASRFTRTADGCDAQTLAPGASCRIGVSFSAPDTARHDATLTLTLRQGASSSTFTRSLALSGMASPPPATGGGAGDDGGGALGLGWLLALGAAVAVLSRRRCRA